MTKQHTVKVSLIMDRHNTHYKFPYSVSLSLDWSTCKTQPVIFSKLCSYYSETWLQQQLLYWSVYFLRLWRQWKQFGFILYALFIGYIFPDANK